MRILITNDDSVNAKQLLPLIKWCQKFGEVTTVVPLEQQSGKSHGIEIFNPFEVREVILDSETTVLAVDSTPADCVRYAVLGLEKPFDLVISGINKGLNIGTDTLYSGTVAAVQEAAILGIPAIALSTSPENYDSVIQYLDRVCDYILQNKLLEKHSLYNINIPSNPKEILITRLGGAYYSDSFIDIGDGRVQANGKCVYKDSGDLTLDTDAVMSGYISITPITINMTDMDVFKKLR